MKRFCVSCRQMEEQSGFQPFYSKAGKKLGEKCENCSTGRVPGRVPPKTQAVKVRKEYAPRSRFQLEDFQTEKRKGE